jgi:hypothetical protein
MYHPRNKSRDLEVAATYVKPKKMYASIASKW